MNDEEINAKDMLESVIWKISIQNNQHLKSKQLQTEYDWLPSKIYE